MTHLAITAAALWLPAGMPAAGQEVDYAVYTEPPRLFLTARRLKLLQREKERESIRWQQFETLMAGGAAMPEAGFAEALYGAVTGQGSACGKAGAWAVKAADPRRQADLRQLALVYDWCGASMPEAERMALAARIKPQLGVPASGPAAVRSQVLAALAIADEEPKLVETVLRNAVEQWWKQTIIPQLLKGQDPFTRREDLFAVIEFLHAIRDNLRVDLREPANKWFSELPARQLLRYYPQPWPAAENEYRIPAYEGPGDPDLREALFSRAAELALVAFDTNAQPNQFLQGWLLQDRFLLRSPLGITYEFLWANPYLPGLSFHFMPDVFHEAGELLVRGGWDEDATWFGYSRGMAQGFAKGSRVLVRPGSRPAPLALGPARVFFAASGLRFETGWQTAPAEGGQTVEEVAFVVGLEPGTAYDVEVDDEGMFEARSDAGGILELKFMPGRKAGVRLRKAAPVVR